MKKKPKNTIHEEKKVFLGLIPPALCMRLAHKIKFLSRLFTKFNPKMAEELKACDYNYTPEEYMGIGLVTYNILGFFLGFLVYNLFITKGQPVVNAIISGVLIWLLVIGILAFMSAKSLHSQLLIKSINIDRNLIYALKDMVLNAKSGGTLYEAMVSVSNAEYGLVTEEFDRAVREINVGKPIMKALEALVDRTRSDYLRKTGWRLINNLKTGSDLEIALGPIISELDTYQKIQIQNYAKELSLWSLVYMMFSVAIPTIGSTMMVILSAFSAGGISAGGFIAFVSFCFILQIGLAYFVKQRRPNVQF